MSTSSILTLCTGNICRSPVAQSVLTSALINSGIVVRSAGTLAAVGRAAAPEAVAYVRSALGIELSHRASRLDRGALIRSDLILVMTAEQRRWVALEEPRVLRRTFTLLELARIASDVPKSESFPDLRSFAHGCARLRTRRPGHSEDPDIEDPYGGPPEAYTRSFTQVHAAAGVVAQAIIRSVQPAPDSSSSVPSAEECAP